MSRIRPQIMVALLCATIFGLFVAWIGYKMNHVEVVVGVSSGLLSLFVVVAIKILESEGE